MTHMTGEAHWLEAERLLAQAEMMETEVDMSWPALSAIRDALLHRADIHAKLAAAARDYGMHVERIYKENS